MIKGLTGLALGAGLALVAAGCVERTGAVRPAGPTLAGPAAAPSGRATQRAGRDVGAPAPAAQPAPRKPGFYRGTGEFLSEEAFARRVREVPATGDVTLNFADADIREVVRTVLGDLLGLNYLVDPNVSGMVTVQTSSPLARSALLPALESILRVNGAALVKDGALYRVVPWETAAQAAPPLVAGVRGGRVAGFGIQIVPLEFISAVEMEKILEPFAPKGSILKADEARSLLILAGTREERATLLEAVALFDVDWLKGMSFGLFPLEYGSAEELVGELEIVFGEETPLAGLVRVVPVERLNAVLVISQKPQYLEEAQTWIERLDQSVDGEVQRVYVYYVQNGRAVDLAVVLTDIFGAGGEEGIPEARLAPGLERVELRAEALQRRGGAMAGVPTRAAAAAEPEDEGPAPRRPEAQAAPLLAAEGIALAGEREIRIIADEANNALVILATPQDYRMVESALKKLDITPLQVLIEASIFEVTLTDDLEYGLQWFFKSGGSEFTLSKFLGGIGDPEVGFSYFFTGNAGDVQLVLNALHEITDLNVVSSPSLMVLDNQTARIQVGDQVPILTQSAVSVVDPEAPIVNAVQMVDTGVILSVTPRVNAGGLVTMEIEQQVNLAEPTDTSGIDSPTIRQRSITSTVAIQSGQTVTLGGLITDQQDSESSGLPGLSKIPILGALFGTQRDDKARTELLVLITPRVVSNEEEAREVTDELKRRMRTVQPLGRWIR